MKISLNDTGKRFQKHWIFRNLSFEFSQPNTYALLGPNGSGKSTLLRVISGMQAPSLGKVTFSRGGQPVEASKVFAHISFSAPGQEIVDELTLREFLSFHFSFKKPLPGFTTDSIIKETGLAHAADKPIGDYSSGMRQRVKLAQAIFSDTQVLLLDEPCTNLDQQGVEQYRHWMEQFAKGRMVIVASNDAREYDFCKEHLSIADYK